MQKIESFKIDHEKLYSGLYVSRLDNFDNNFITTFDMRFTAPNKEIPLEVPAIHTIEHLFATYFRNSKIKNKIVYFGPMGCRTGFYLIVYGKWESENILPYLLNCLDYVIDFNGEIPGATPKECGNYKEQDLIKAKEYSIKYKSDLLTFKRFKY